MARYRAAIDAGGDLQEITQWINAAKAERLQAEAVLRTMPAPARMSREDVRAMIEQFASLAAVIGSADPADKAEIYQGLNLMLTYQPTTQTVRAEARLTVDSHGVMVRVRGGIDPVSPHCSMSYSAEINL
jgi:site-specific DNA recombinase